MSDDPKSIWIFESDGRSVPRAGDWVDEQSEAPEGAPEYRRADLPPTLSAAMELPEVKELMEAMERAIEAIDAAYDGPDDNGAYTVRERAALAAIKEPKT